MSYILSLSTWLSAISAFSFMCSFSSKSPCVGPSSPLSSIFGSGFSALYISARFSKISRTISEQKMTDIVIFFENNHLCSPAYFNIDILLPVSTSLLLTISCSSVVTSFINQGINESSTSTETQYR